MMLRIVRAVFVVRGDAHITSDILTNHSQIVLFVHCARAHFYLCRANVLPTERLTMSTIQFAKPVVRLLTVGAISERLGVPLHRVQYTLRSRPWIRPAALAGRTRLFDNDALAAIRAAMMGGGQ